MTEWNTALNNRVVKETRFIDKETNKEKIDKSSTVYDDSVIVSEVSTTMFRDTEIQITRNHSAENKFYVNLFVPKTNKQIPNKLYRTKAHCAATIMMALTMGTEIDERRQARLDRRYVEIQNRIRTKRTNTLRNGGFSDICIEAILQYIKDHPIPKRSYIYDSLITILSKHYADLTGTCDAVKALDEQERGLHVERMYEQACVLQTRSFTTEEGDPSISHKAAGRLFREVETPVRLPPGMTVVRSIYRQIDSEVKSNTRLMRIVNILVAMYEAYTGVTPLQILSGREVRKAKLRESRLANIQGGHGRYSVTSGMNKTTKPNDNNNSKRNWKKEHHSDNSKKQFNKKQEGLLTVGEALGSAFDSLASEHK